jgi:hypothetical protein
VPAPDTLPPPPPPPLPPPPSASLKPESGSCSELDARRRGQRGRGDLAGRQVARDLTERARGFDGRHRRLGSDLEPAECLHRVTDRFQLARVRAQKRILDRLVAALRLVDLRADERARSL